MQEVERVIGRLEEFHAWSKVQFHALDMDLLKITATLEEINRDRFKFYGKLSVINAAVLVLLETLVHNYMIR